MQTLHSLVIFFECGEKHNTTHLAVKCNKICNIESLPYRCKITFASQYITLREYDMIALSVERFY